MVRQFWRALWLPALALSLSMVTLLVFVAAASAQRTEPLNALQHQSGATTHAPGIATAVTTVTLTGPTEGVTGTPYPFTARVDADATAPFTFTWQSDEQVDVVVTSTLRSNQIIYTWNVTGTQFITVTAVNADGGPVTATGSIDISAPPSETPLEGVTIAGADTVQAGEEITLTAVITPSSATNVTYTWSPDPESGQGTSTATYNFATAGVQTVTLVALNSGGGPFTATKMITVQSGGTGVPLTGVRIDGPDTLELAGNLSTGINAVNQRFTAVPTPTNATTVTYQWSGNPNLGGGNTQATYTFNALGTYPITVVAQNAGGGTFTATKVVNVVPIPLTSVSFSRPPTNGRVNEGIQFNIRTTPNNPTLPVTFTWTPEPTSVSQGGTRATITFSQTGLHTVSVVAVTPYSDPVSATTSIQITEGGTNVPLTGVEITGPTQGIAGEVLELSAAITPLNASDPITYTWSPTPTVGQGTAQPTYRFAAPGTVVISLTAANPLGSATDAITVQIVAPTVFSGTFEAAGGTLEAAYYGTSITFAPNTFSTTTNVTYESTITATPPTTGTVISRFTLSSDSVTPTLPVSFTGTISYTTAQLGDVDPETLQVQYWNGTQWVDVPTTRTTGQVAFSWDRFGQFILIGRTQDEGGTIYLPFVRK